MPNYFVPELLGPAGSLEKLKVSVRYGVDAVYLGGEKFGLRAASENFTEKQLLEGIKFAHDFGVKTYVVLNGFLFDKDLVELPSFVESLSKLNVDAVIVSDIGVIETVKKYSNIDIHLSTQSSCVNSYSAMFYKNMGVKRIVVGRELSITEAAKIKQNVGIEIEMFTHGSMCMAYSGNCTISNFTQGRDSNRGGCAHSCRFEYTLSDDKRKTEKTAYFMSSKDLSGISLIGDFSTHQIDSLKIEGRMKGPLYAATTAKIYRQAIDYYKLNGNFLNAPIKEWSNELEKLGHRDYTMASLLSPADKTSVFNKRESTEHEWEVVGPVVEVKENKHILVKVNHAFEEDDLIEFLTFKNNSISFKAKELKSIQDETIQRTRPGMLVKLPYFNGVELHNIVRGKRGKKSTHAI